MDKNLSKNKKILKNKLTIKEIYIYNPSNMPKTGWIHACFGCREYTSRTILFKTVIKQPLKYEFNIHCCPRCKRSHKNINNYEIFSEKCNNYILKKYYSITG
jgi:hypothetical protein